MIKFSKDTYQGLQGGTGTVNIYTFTVFGRLLEKISILRLEPLASIGTHQHVNDSEVYITCNNSVILSDKSCWKPWEYCPKGGSHFAKNNSHRPAWILSIKH